jgi:hypothetical protein
MREIMKSVLESSNLARTVETLQAIVAAPGAPSLPPTVVQMVRGKLTKSIPRLAITWEMDGLLVSLQTLCFQQVRPSLHSKCTAVAIGPRTIRPCDF